MLRRALASFAALSTWSCVALPAQAGSDALAEALLAKLSLRDKAGQVLMAWTLAKAEGQAGARQKLLREVREAGLGGIVLSLGPVRDAAPFVAELQAAAAVPLIFAADFEGGVGFRLTDATDFGRSMLLGAAGDEQLVAATARATAREAKALGLHWNFAPVLDVNVNPQNPIINVRSFGEDPRLVARLGAAYVRGLQSEGVLATGKHFPGHGDVASDSHLAMPTVPGDRARLDSVELLPFRAAIDAGVASIMTGHLAVPGLGEAADVPATLSPRILGELLRKQLGFTGIIATDALDMGGVKGKHQVGEVAVRALLAGADLLLMPPEPLVARDAVVAAVESGRVPAARLDDAVRKLLRAKARAGLLSGGGRPSADWANVVHGAEHRALADAVATAGLTLVRDARGALPMREPSAAPMFELFDSEEREQQASTLAAALGSKQVTSLHPKSGDAAIAAAAAALARAEAPIVALHVKVRAFTGKIGLPPAFAPVVAALQQRADATVVSFGNPYLLAEFAAVPTYLCAYDSTAATVRAAAGALRGGQPLQARLPVTIPGVAPRGSGLSWWPVVQRDETKPLPRNTPEQQGFAADLPARLRATLEAAVAAQVAPGAVCVVTRRGAVVAEVAVGRHDYAPEAAKVEPSTPYDLASLTKVCATTPLALRLIAQGKLSLDTKVAELVPEFRGPGKDRVTIRHLLTHRAGLVPYLPLFKQHDSRAKIVAAAVGEGLRTEPDAETLYSDLGMLLLMVCMERVGDTSFEQMVKREVFGPLGMSGAQFVRPGQRAAAPPTEQCAWRGRLVQGEVHDENAYAMGGVSGHAGLFACAEDVAKLGQAFLAGGGDYLPPALARLATQRHEAHGSRGLGFDLLTEAGFAGARVGAGAFGHTGFTGTSLLCDPNLDLCVVLLTNRVHPTRVNAKIQKLRRDLHELVYVALGA